MTRPRVPFRWTSRLRDAARNALADGFDPLVARRVPSPWLEIAQSPVFRSSIAMAVNPASVRFEQTKRIAEVTTRGGTAFFFFSNEHGNARDVLRMSMNGNTGNLDLRGSIGVPGLLARGAPRDEGPQTGAFNKWVVWHNFYALTQEPELLADKTRNVVTLTLQTKLFRFPLILKGHFPKVMSFEESADQPNSQEYSVDFVVTQTEPDLSEILLQISRGVTGQPPASNRPSANIAGGVPGSTFVSVNAGDSAAAIVGDTRTEPPGASTGVSSKDTENLQ